MKPLSFLFLLFSQAAWAQYQYTAPMAGSRLNSPSQQIILREGSFVDPATIREEAFSVSGSRSGAHPFQLILSTDQKTIILKPHEPFAFSEEVTVTVHDGLKSKSGNSWPPYSFRFTTHREYSAPELASFRSLKNILWEEELKRSGLEEIKEAGTDTRIFTGSITIVNNSNPSPGELFYDAWTTNFISSNYDGYAIMTTSGDSLFQSAKDKYCQDFDLNPNGYLSVFDYDQGEFDVLDSNMNIIDSYEPANGRSADVHEFTIYENGHAFMIAGEFQVVDMSVYDPDWNPNTTVLCNVIQEFDAAKNLIFEWRAFDHVDVTETNQNMAFGYIDYTHTNSIELAADGNLIVSHRHLDQITKIDKATGAFIWRLGGDSNQFVFSNDAEQFRWQHSAREMADGNILLYDNGNSHSPQHSSAKEYALDFINQTATLVWNFQPKTYTGGNAYFLAMGSVQRLENGNTLVNGGWDYSSNQSNFWEVTPDGDIVWEAALNNSKSLVSYRAFKHPWNPCAPVAPTTVAVTKITDTSAKVSWAAVAHAVSYDIQYRKLNKPSWKLKTAANPSKKIKNLAGATSYEYQVRANCQNGYISDWTDIDTFTTLPGRFTEPGVKTTPDDAYPNPASAILHIPLNEPANGLDVLDLSGAILLSIKVPYEKEASVVTLDVSSLPAGLYLAKLHSDGAANTFRFVKE